MKIFRVRFFCLFAILIPIVLSFPEKGFAYPGFSRSYDFPCAFCHIQWPKLNDNGNIFKDRGFMLSTTGRGNGLDMTFSDPENQNYFPVGFRMSESYDMSAVNGVLSGQKTNGGWANGANSQNPWSLESGGLLNPWISYWVEPGFRAGGSFGITKLWIRFDDLFHSTWLNLYAGQESVDSPFSAHRSVSIGTASPYTMYDYQPGTAEIVTNSGAQNAGFSFVNPVGAYFDGDRFQMGQSVTSIRYFGYQFENGCGTRRSFSVNPCETRLDVSFIPNSSLYSSSNSQGVSGGSAAQTAATPPVYSLNSSPNNGFSYFVHLTQSFGGWGATSGERVGLFSYVGEGSSAGVSGGNSPATVFSREGVDFSLNPVPRGGLNLFGAWEIVQDPTGMIQVNPSFLGSAIPVSGLSYMTWFVEADWQPDFSGFLPSDGTGSNMISAIYNQLNMIEQPAFSGGNRVELPGNFNDVLSFTLLDRYSLWQSERAAVSVYAQYQWLLNDGVSGLLGGFSSNGVQMGGNHQTASYPGSLFGNVTASNFSLGVDFAY